MFVLVGANGFLGSYMIKTILEETNDKIIAADMNISGRNNDDRIEWIECNIVKDSDLERLNHMIMEIEPVDIIYLAAYHHPDEVKKNPKLAWNINITSLSRFLNSIDNVRSFFYSSTEMVYGAGKADTLFTENSRLAPVNIYGRHKVVAESMVTGYGYNVVRFPFLIGPSIIDGVKHFYDIIAETVKDGRTIEMFRDAYKSALDFNTASQTLIRLIKSYSDNMPKILNISGDEILTKYEIGVRIAQKFGCSSELITPISVNEDNKIFTEKRADCTLLDNSLVKEVLHIKDLKMQF